MMQFLLSGFAIKFVAFFKGKRSETSVYPVFRGHTSEATRTTSVTLRKNWFNLEQLH